MVEPSLRTSRVVRGPGARLSALCPCSVCVQCDLTKPGDRVLVSGIHRALPSKANQSGMFKTLLLANALLQLTRELAHDAFTREDLENIL